MCRSQTFDEEPNCSAITVAQAQRRSIHQLRPNMARYQVQPIAKTTRKLQPATKISSTPAKATMCGPVSSFGPRRHNAAKTPRTSSFGPWNARPSSGQDEDSSSFGPKDVRPPSAHGVCSYLRSTAPTPREACSNSFAKHVAPARVRRP